MWTLLFFKLKYWTANRTEYFSTRSALNYAFSLGLTKAMRACKKIIFHIFSCSYYKRHKLEINAQNDNLKKTKSFLTHE